MSLWLNLVKVKLVFVFLLFLLMYVKHGELQINMIALLYGLSTHDHRQCTFWGDLT